jgi:prolyl oligopeptidase
MAYTISRSGSDWSEIYVMDVQSRQLTGDHIIWAKFTGAAWHGDGFYYSGYPQPKEGSELSGINENHTVYYHQLGTPQSQDEVAYADKRYPKRFYTASTDEEEQWLIIDEDGADNGNRVFVKNLNQKNTRFVELASDFRYRHGIAACLDNDIYMLTNEDAPNYRLVKINLRISPGLKQLVSRQQEDVIPESSAVLSNAQLIGGKWVVTYGQDASDHAYIYSMEGKKEREIQLPTFGSVSFSGEKKERGCFYTFTSFTFPAVIYRLDVETGESVKFRTPQVAFNPEDYICEQLFVTSKDGTKVPMFITYKKGLQRNGKNPVYLYGYGGFNISLTPGFSPYRIPFLEAGGIYASVNLRGGSEYGEAWHLAGTKMQKQNVFDDCIAAAEHLIKEKYTKAGKICIAGGSNGGLLVGAVVNQRPDLFGAALPAVGVMDMLRYHLFTIGWNWAPDYGTSADSEEMFKYLYAYSPLHNIRNDGTPYPPILITTADHDDRVVPAHSFKYAATLQASNTGNAPKLIMIETKAGHGAGKPLSKVLESQTATWGFAMYELGMQPKWE